MFDCIRLEEHSRRLTGRAVRGCAVTYRCIDHLRCFFTNPLKMKLETLRMLNSYFQTHRNIPALVCSLTLPSFFRFNEQLFMVVKTQYVAHSY